MWEKKNCMPSSVTDRPTKSHEYIFLLAKQERYYYDAQAIKEPAIKGAAGSTFHIGKTGIHSLGRASTKERTEDGFRNKRSVWTVNTRSYKGAHFATFPPELITPCILVGCPPGGVVLDPFMGSGTTLATAKQHGRSVIGIELNEDYCLMAEERIAAVQPRLMV